jgi:hypothetical protein
VVQTSLQAFQHVSTSAFQLFAFDSWPIALEETLVGTGM